jgi:hypothetical protein
VSRGLASPAGFVLAALAAGAACGRSQGVSDEQLGDLVLDRKGPEAPIDAERAAKDPAELGRALARAHTAVIAALGPHRVSLATKNSVIEDGKQVSVLDDQTLIEVGQDGAFHTLYTTAADQGSAKTGDYGSETIFVGGKLYLRPRYQRWHERAPEEPAEPAAIRDRAFGGIAAAWDLLAPGAELIDRGALQVAGRAGRKIEVRKASSPATPPPERLIQRKWRETRSIEELSGEIVLDAEKGVPLAVKLAGAIGFTRDGKRRTMKLGVEAAITKIGTPAEIAAPARGDVVATPERMREVDDRDFLLRNIAPPIRRNPDGTAATPQPQLAAPAAADPGKPKPDQPKPDQPKPDQPKPDQPKPDQPAPDKPAPASQGAK